jgi:hypothetical protein
MNLISEYIFPVWSDDEHKVSGNFITVFVEAIE